MSVKYIKPNYSNIVLAGLIDAIVAMIFFITLFSMMTNNLINPNLSILLGFVFYRFITIFLFDCTLGMKVFKMLFLNYDEEKLSIKEKLLASFFILYEGVDYYKEVRAYT